MIDREKVIKGLEWIYRCVSPVNHTCGDCPYQDNHVECIRRALSDAIALIKEQESVIEALKSDLSETLAVLGEQPEIVRCLECKYRGNSEKCVLSAISEEKNFPLFMLDNRGDWFCADGERE